MKKEDLPWRSFADPGDAGQGPVAARWNLTNTPTLYVLDARGVIRHKWPGSPGHEAMDSALNALVKEAEREGPLKSLRDRQDLGGLDHRPRD